MKRKTPKKIDPTFKSRFGIKTSIRYFLQPIVEKGNEKQFKRAWKRFYSKAESPNSDTRTKKIDAFFRHLEKLGSDERYCQRVRIRFISPKVGYGVFALCDIPPYSILHHYTGVFRRDRDIPEKNNSTFAIEDFSSFSIDAAKMGNWTRFMNHGEEKASTTNVIVWEHYLEEGPRIVFTSGRNGIKKGRQLLYPYGDEYWEGSMIVTF